MATHQERLAVSFSATEKAIVEQKLEGRPFSYVVRQMLAREWSIDLPALKPGTRKKETKAT